MFYQIFCAPCTFRAPGHSRFLFVFSCSLILTHLWAPSPAPVCYFSFYLQAFVPKFISTLPATQHSLLSSLFSNCPCLLEPAFFGYSCMKIIAFVNKIYFINWNKILQNFNIFIYREFLFSFLWFPQYFFYIFFTNIVLHYNEKLRHKKPRRNRIKIYGT